MVQSLQRTIAAGALPPRQLACMNRGAPACNGHDVITTAANCRLVYRQRAFIGAGGAVDIAPAYTGIYINATGGTETALENAHTVKCHLEIPSAPGNTVKVFTWGGATSTTIAGGVGLRFADTCPATYFGYASYIPPGTECYWLTEMEVAIGDRHIAGYVTPTPLIPGEASIKGGAFTGDTTNTNPATKIGVAGALGFGGGGANPWVSLTGIKYGPVLVVGRQAFKVPVWLGVGDSIMQRISDNGGDGYNDGATPAGGWFRRGLANLYGAIIPAPNTDAGNRGETLATYRANKTLRGAMYPYHTHVICDYGTNDFAGAATVLQVEAALSLEIGVAKAAGIKKWFQMLLIPRTTGAWTLADGSDQTVLVTAGWDTKRPAYNTDVTNYVAAAGVDGIVDLHTGILTNTGGGGVNKWLAPAITSDGTHPDPAIVGAMATAFAAFAATQTYDGT